MATLRQILSILLVLATSASTVLANMPHVSCRCVDGQSKPICFTGDVSCCTPAPDEAAPCCCCEAEAAPVVTKQEPSPHGSVEGRSCQRTFVAAEDISRIDKGATFDASPTLSVPFTEPNVASFSQSRSTLVVMSSPPDRVILFQHLVI